LKYKDKKWTENEKQFKNRLIKYEQIFNKENPSRTQVVFFALSDLSRSPERPPSPFSRRPKGGRIVQFVPLCGTNAGVKNIASAIFFALYRFDCNSL
jgi:hypothetical protein